MKYKEYSIGELLDYEQPSKYIVSSTEYNDKYKTPVLTAGKTFIIGYTDELEGIFDNIPVIIFDDFTTATQFVNFKFKVKSSAMKILKSRHDWVNIKYMYYLMQSIRFEHSTHKRYWLQHYSKIKVKIPSLDEQLRIVARIEELFSELENGIENLKKAKAQLGIYKQAVLKEAFEGKLTHNHYDVTKYMCKINAYRNDNGYKIKYSMMEHFELPQIPDSWKWCCIGDIATKSEYGTSKKSSKMGKVPVIRMGNIQNGQILWNDLVFSNDDDEIKQYMVKKGDVLFNRTNSPELVGKTAIFSDDREALFAGYLIRINQVPMINAKYLNYFLNSPIARQYGNLVKTDGVNQSNINSKKMYSYPFPLCTEKEQLEIVEEIETRLSVCENIEKTVDTALEQAEIMRQSILKQAFEGRL